MNKLDKVRWGIMGAGQMADNFAADFIYSKDSILTAVASLDKENGKLFADKFKIDKIYNDYNSLVIDKDIDIVYISTPNSLHFSNIKLCIENNKSILCEKPFALNSTQAKEIELLLKEKQIFCMEGMWMRFIPLIQKVKQIIESDKIGKILRVSADFGYPTEFDPKNRFFNRDLGGGALLDRGVYPISLCLYLFGPPDRFLGDLYIGETGVDEQSAIIFYYKNGILCQLSSSLNGYATNTVIITGTKGNIKIYPPFCNPKKISIELNSGEPVVYSSKKSKKSLFIEPEIQYIEDYGLGNGFIYEIEEAAKCFKQGLKESPLMSLKETINTLEIIDRLKLNLI